MSRALFMARLKEGLTGLPQSDFDAVVSDYEFHFAEAAAAGQSEEEVAARLGDPVRLARDLRSDMEERHSGAEKSARPPHLSVAGKIPASAPRARKALVPLLILLGVTSIAAAYYFDTRNRVSIPAQSVSTQNPIQRQIPSLSASGGKVEISGDQVLDLGTVTQEHLEITVDGGGRVTARGRVKEMTVHIDGSGIADFGAVQADIVHVDVSGTGNAEVWAIQTADITISGSGFVRLKVKPNLLKQSLTGSGHVLLPN